MEEELEKIPIPVVESWPEAKKRRIPAFLVSSVQKKIFQAPKEQLNSFQALLEARYRSWQRKMEAGREGKESIVPGEEEHFERWELKKCGLIKSERDLGKEVIDISDAVADIFNGIEDEGVRTLLFWNYVEAVAQVVVEKEFQVPLWIEMVASFC